MTDAPELLPCPFCGSSDLAVFRHFSSQPYRSVMCRGCKASAVSEERWRTRADLHQQALDAAREEGRRARLEEAAGVLQLLANQARGSMNRCRPSAKSAEWATIVAHLMNAEDDIRALIDKPADPVVEKARKPKDHDRTMKEALFGLIGSSQEPVENPVREDISYGGVLVNTPDGPKVAYLRLSFENIAQKDGK